MSRIKLLLCAVCAVGLLAALPASSLALSNKALTKRTTTLNKKVSTIGKDVGTLKSSVTSLEGTITSLGAVADAAPQIIDGLTQLKNGLTTLGQAYSAVEYGVVTVSRSDGGVIGIAPQWTSDIPDDGNAASTAGEGVAVLAAGASVTFNLDAIVRSNEADQDGKNGPVAQGGGMLWVTGAIAGNATYDGAFIPCTNTGSVAQTATGEPIRTPDGLAKDKPLVNITSGVPRTDQSLPGNDSSHLIQGGCAFTAPASGAYIVHYSASLLDIPTSTSPGPRD